MITVDTTDAIRLGTWWARVLGGRIVEENDGWFVIVAFGDGRPALGFQKVDEPTRGKNRLHLDLHADDVAAEVSRLVAEGATSLGERSVDGAFSWTTLTDPDGNEFCIASH